MPIMRTSSVVVFLMQALLESVAASSAIPDNPPFPLIEVTTAVGKQDQSATRPDGSTVVVALNTVGSSDPTR